MTEKITREGTHPRTLKPVWLANVVTRLRNRFLCFFNGHDMQEHTDDWQDPEYGHGSCSRCGKGY